MLERDIERRLIAPVKALGGVCWKFETPGYTGVPDRIILLPGGIVRFVETKQPGKKERPRQRFVHSLLRSLGFTVYSTVDSVEKISAIIADCEKLVSPLALVESISDFAADVAEGAEKVAERITEAVNGKGL